jgi:hypothetical protein
MNRSIVTGVASETSRQSSLLGGVRVLMRDSRTRLAIGEIDQLVMRNAQETRQKGRKAVK